MEAEMHYLQKIIKENKEGKNRGIYSVCSSNKLVIEAALEKAKEDGRHLLVESTANQVNQFGGYTGMKPVDFIKFMEERAQAVGFDKEKLILGGDHLGPLTWTHLNEDEAMENAKELVKEYVEAGYTKIHLDTSMKLKDDPEGPLSVERVAERAAILAQVCESIERDDKPIYIVGSEVPIPGGATDDHDTVQVTSVEDFENQVEAFSKAFKNKGLEEAWKRVIAFVVQPGVEFGNDEIIDYEREKAVDLTNALKNYNQLAFEGHSTDYQLEKNLRQMVEDGVAIIKVGPGLTFALREALYNLEMIEKEMLKESGKFSNFSKVIEKAMNDNPDNWIKHYHGSEFEKKIQRKYSFSDRVRYYLNEPEVERSIEKLFENIEIIKDEIPLGVISQYLPNTYMKIRKKELSRDPKSWVIDAVKEALDPYVKAT